MFRNYLAAALRNLSRNRLYAGVTILGLTVAFASAILIGLYLRHELTYDRFIPGHERDYLINQSISTNGKPPFEMDSSSTVLAQDLKANFPQIELVARLANPGFPPTLRHGDVSVTEQSFLWADPEIFRILPLPTVAGDLAHALDAPDAVVLTRAEARKLFGKDAPLGEQLLVNGVAMRVAAVIEDLPSNTHLAAEAFGSSRAPGSFIHQLEKAGYSANANYTYVQLKPGVSRESAQAAIDLFAQRRLMPILQSINPDAKLSGYKVVFIPFENGRPAGPARDILSGFLAPDERVSYGRPVGVTLGPDGSLLVADDVGDCIWRVSAA